jgi:hypothetical protein
VVTSTGPGPGYAVVFDTYGVPVWWLKAEPSPFDVHLLPDGGLAWSSWQVSRDSMGYYGEYDLAGRLKQTFRTVGSPVNSHDFQLLPNGRALLITYSSRDGVDLSRLGGPRRARVFDGELQQVDPAGRVVWSWNTSGHIRLAESARWRRFVTAAPTSYADGRSGYDIVHLNSVDQEGDRIVISLRHTDAVYEIDRRTGAIVWKLGGTPTRRSLRILGDRYGAKDFGGQHDARIGDHGRSLTLFDNGRGRARAPRALRFRIDAAARTARLVEVIEDPQVGSPVCCGGLRLLPGGHRLVAWGGVTHGPTPPVTEVDRAHRRVFTLQLAPVTFTYRAEPDARGVLSRTALRRGMDAMAP